MAYPDFTIRYPYRHPDTKVRARGGPLVRFSNLPPGTLFLMVGEFDRLYEKLGDSDAACLVPWEYECCYVAGDPLCEVAEPVARGPKVVQLS